MSRTISLRPLTWSTHPHASCIIFWAKNFKTERGCVHVQSTSCFSFFSPKSNAICLRFISSQYYKLYINITLHLFYHVPTPIAIRRNKKTPARVFSCFCGGGGGSRTHVQITVLDFSTYLFGF